MTRKLFCFWTDSNPMPIERNNALRGMCKSGLEVEFITQNNLSEWIVKGHPLHSAYPYLSAIHRADYLRVYFMHHYGGGYSDIKHINNSWIVSWNKLFESDKWAIGYREVGPRGVAIIPSIKYIYLLWHWKVLIGNCAYIFKPGTAFTNEWLKLSNEFLDSKLVDLKLNPANVPEDYRGRPFVGGHSKYPVRWTELLGNIFHPLCLKYSNFILYDLPHPDFNSNYEV